MLSTRVLRAVPIAAICALILLLSGCAAASDATSQSSSASSQNSSRSAQSVQSTSSASASTQTASTQNNQVESEAPIETSTIYITANGSKFEVDLEDNSSATALVEALKSGPITIDASDYGNFEKVGELGMTFPTNDKQTTTVPGDVILYQGDKITVYYGTNSWTFTKIGHIKNADNIKEALGPGSVKLTLSLS